MTDDRMALAELREKGSDSDLLRNLIGYVPQRLMKRDVESLVGAAQGERGEGREDWRNGHRARDWHMRGGTIALRIATLRRVPDCTIARFEAKRFFDKPVWAEQVRTRFIPGLRAASVPDG